jgi:hypothetical protein
MSCKEEQLAELQEQLSRSARPYCRTENVRIHAIVVPELEFSDD